jgi:hypothetical protein
MLCLLWEDSDWRVLGILQLCRLILIMKHVTHYHCPIMFQVLILGMVDEGCGDRYVPEAARGQWLDSTIRCQPQEHLAKSKV